VCIEDYDKALRVKPRFFQAFANRGNTHLRLGNIDQARAAFNRAASRVRMPSGDVLQMGIGVALVVRKATRCFAPAQHGNWMLGSLHCIGWNWRVKEMDWTASSARGTLRQSHEIPQRGLEPRI